MGDRIFKPIPTNQLYNLKAGAAKAYWRPAISSVVFTAVSNDADIAHTAATTTIQTASGADPGWHIGHVLCVVRTGEKMVVTAEPTDQTTHWETTVVRGVDNTPATAINAGDRIKTDGLALQLTAGIGSANNAPIFTDSTTNADIDTTKSYILRRGFDAVSKELLYPVTLDNDGVTASDVIRNYNLQQLALYNPSDLATDEFLFIAGEDFFPPEVSTFKLGKWQEFEFKEGVTVTPEFEAIQTDSNLRIGPNFANHLRYMVAFQSAIVSPELWGFWNGGIEAGINSAADENHEFLGVPMDTFYGSELAKIQMFIEGREARSNKKLEFFIYAGTLNSPGEVLIGPEQRMQEMTFDASQEPKALSVGVYREALVC